jgi:hypothetical protein
VAKAQILLLSCFFDMSKKTSLWPNLDEFICGRNGGQLAKQIEPIKSKKVMEVKTK